ncbi:MAG TPA: AAA family ATPase [Phycisphaerae bacterium]|nr:AAA family ATPase [Phycisphaerae bacterium]
MKVISIINQKGGVGKTTTVANLAAAMAAAGRKVAVIDLDPQSHLTLHFGFEPADDTATIYDVLCEQATMDEAMVKVRDNLWVVPATTDLAAATAELVSRPNRNMILRNAIDAMKSHVDFMMIDCPPSLGLLTLNALAATDDVIIPLQPQFLALQGLSKLLRTIELVNQRINPKLRVAGVVFCMFEQVTRLARDVVTDVMKFFKSTRTSGKPWADACVYHTAIRRNIKLAECPSFGQSIFEYDAQCNGARDYRALADEFLNRIAAVQPESTVPADMPSITQEHLGAEEDYFPAGQD